MPWFDKVTFNGKSCRDFGLTVVEFDDEKNENTSVGSDVKFTTVTAANSDRSTKTASSYGSYSFKYQLAALDCNGMPKELTMREQSKITRWLVRKDGFKPLKIDSAGYEDLVFNVQQTITKKEIGGIVRGYIVSANTDYPYALTDERVLNFTIASANGQKVIFDDSDEEGHRYCDISVKCLANGNLSIKNENAEGTRFTVVNNCTQGEIITLSKDLIPSTSLSSTHPICNDFNYAYLRLANKGDEYKNTLTFSMPCEVTLKYQFVRKVGV